MMEIMEMMEITCLYGKERRKKRRLQVTREGILWIRCIDRQLGTLSEQAFQARRGRQIRNSFCGLVDIARHCEAHV